MGPAAARGGVCLPAQSVSHRLGPREEASNHKGGVWAHGRLSPQGLGPQRLGSRAVCGGGRGRGQLRGRGSGRQVAASGCRSAPLSALERADLARLWDCSAGPKGDAGVAWAGNRTRASRVAGENSTTEPPMHRWPPPPDAAPEALANTRPSLLTARPVGICLLHPSRRRRAADLKARVRARAGPQGAALSEGPRGGGPPAHSAGPAPSAPTTAAATLSVSPEGARSRRRLRGQALRGRRGRAPTFLSATCRVPTQNPSGGLAFRQGRDGACHCGRGPGPRARPVLDARERGSATPRGAPAAAPSGAQAPGPKGVVSLAPALWPTALAGAPL